MLLLEWLVASEIVIILHASHKLILLIHAACTTAHAGSKSAYSCSCSSVIIPSITASETAESSIRLWHACIKLIAHTSVHSHAASSTHIHPTWHVSVETLIHHHLLHHHLLLHLLLHKHFLLGHHWVLLELLLLSVKTCKVRHKLRLVILLLLLLLLLLLWHLLLLQARLLLLLLLLLSEGIKAS